MTIFLCVLWLQRYETKRNRVKKNPFFSQQHNKNIYSTRPNRKTYIFFFSSLLELLNAVTKLYTQRPLIFAMPSDAHTYKTRKLLVYLSQVYWITYSEWKHNNQTIVLWYWCVVCARLRSKRVFITLCVFISFTLLRLVLCSCWYDFFSLLTCDGIDVCHDVAIVGINKGLIFFTIATMQTRESVENCKFPFFTKVIGNNTL